MDNMLGNTKLNYILMRQLTPLQVLTASAIWHSAVKSAKRLVGLLVRSAPLIVGSSSVSWVKAAFNFARFVRVTIIHQGHRGLAIYLKTANVQLMRSIAGKRLENSRDIGGAVSRTKSGLPRVIPAGMRQRIKEGDTAVIRLYLGFFTLYRVLNFRGKLKLSTITSPGVPIYGGFMSEWSSFAIVFFTYLKAFGVKRVRTDLVPVPFGSRASQIVTEVHPNPMGIVVKDKSSLSVTKNAQPPRGCRLEIWGYVVKLFPLLKSGPNSKRGRVNSYNIINDLLAWVQRPQLFRSFQVLVAITRSWILFSPTLGSVLSYMGSKFPILLSPHHGAFWLGKLSVKEEPGKLRVFAMVDSLTQWLLYPLHRMIFDKVLRLIPQDGTFDQIAPVKRLIAILQGGRDHRVWSFDLSAATDRIPVMLQEVLLGHFMTPEFASHWRMILCDREYKAPDELVKQDGWLLRDGVKLGRVLKYAVGQPMGAYSSWAMLALVHHMMVQFAAWKAGSRGWFERYAVLGDDLVIGDYRVAREYLSLCDVIGVEVNMSKSIVSNNLSLEFAKRFFYKGTEVTPIPLLGLAVGWLGVRDIAEIASQVYSRTGKRPTFYMMGRFIGLGMSSCTGLGQKLIFSMGRRARSIVLLLLRPGSSHGVADLLKWYTVTRATGSSLSHQGAWPTIAAVVRQRIAHFQALNLRKRLFKALLSFDLVPMLKLYWGSAFERMAWFGLATWWHENVIVPYKAPMLEKLDEIDLVIKDINRVIESKDEATLLRLLQTMEDLEEQVALVPTAVRLQREERDVLHRKVDKYPKRVRGWTKLIRKFRRAYQNARHDGRS